MSFQYLTAAKLVEAVENGKSLKSVCAAMPKLGKTEYALAMQTLKFLPVLRSMMSTLEISAKSLDVKSGLLQVMLYELTFGTGKISGGGQVKRKVMEYQARLLDMRASLMEGKTHYDELLSETVQAASKLPLYVRVNEAKLSVADGLQHLQSNYEVDAHLDDLVPSLVVLSHQCKALAQDPLVKEGKLVIQDKASCFPAQILYNEFRRRQTNKSTHAQFNDFLDACAAPGNKTSHLAALVGPDADAQRVFAFDKSPHRAQIITRRMRLLGVDSTVTVANRDFLTVDVSEPRYANVRYLLLDPSCSGSGIVRNIERVIDVEAPGAIKGRKSKTTTKDVSDDDEEDDSDANPKLVENNDEDSQQQRLLKLQKFQISIIEKAMTFPQAEAISYSTCSIHCEENEDVVRAVLTSEVGAEWQLSAIPGFSSWKHRGIASPGCGLDQEQAHRVLRCSPEDGTNGFFVALFTRKCDTKRVRKDAATMAPHHHKDVATGSNAQVEEVARSIVKATGKTSRRDEDPARDEATAGRSFLQSKFSVSKNKKRKFGRR